MWNQIVLNCQENVLHVETVGHKKNLKRVHRTMPGGDVASLRVENL